MDRVAIWLRDNAPDGWAATILCVIIWLMLCLGWGAVWGFVFLDWDWLVTRTWGRVWVVAIGLWVLYLGNK